MKSFEECMEDLCAARYRDPHWSIAVEGALEALAAERAEARRAAENKCPPRFAMAIQPDARSFQGPNDTRYRRAMTAPRMGGQHPHDGRHIVSIGSWGMH